MAKHIKSLYKDDQARVLCDAGDGELRLIGRGRHAYLWVGKRERGTDTVAGWRGVTTYSGQIALRKLARAILGAVGDT